MERTKVLFALLFVAAAFGFLFLSVRRATLADAAGPGLIAPAAAKDAPDFALPDAATGKSVRLTVQTQTQPVVLDFWATWCGPCRAELPHLEKLSQHYTGRVRFYGINSSDPSQVTTAYAKQNGFSFPMLTDADHHVTFLYGADAIPLLVIVDTHGKVRAVTTGYSDSENVEAELTHTLDALLSEEKRTP